MVLGDRVVVARYWGHVFGGKVLRVDGIGNWWFNLHLTVTVIVWMGWN